MKNNLILLILFSFISCSKETTILPNILAGKIKSDGKQNYHYKTDTLDYIENFGNGGAGTVKYFYKDNKIDKIYAYNVNGHIHSYYFKYENDKLIQIIDSFVLWKSEEYEIVNYDYIDSINVLATKRVIKNGLTYGLPIKYSFQFKNNNLIRLQQGESIDSFEYDTKINPRSLYLGFNYLFDYIFIDYIGYSWIFNTSKNNIIKEYGRNINYTNYNIKEYTNVYDKNGILQKVIGDSKSSNYLYLNYKYY